MSGGSASFESRFRALLAPWPGRFRRAATPEGLVGVALALAVAVAAGLAMGPPVALLFALVTGGLHLATVEHGGHAMVWTLNAWLIALVVMGLVVGLDDASPLLYTAGGVAVLAHAETIRLTHARRRDAVVERHPVLGAVAALVIASGLGSAAAVLAVALADGPARAWWWLPGAAAALLIGAAITALAPTVRAPRPERARWQPGDRIPPPSKGGGRT